MNTILFILLQALTIQQGEQTIVYHMPFTEIAIDVHYTQQVRKAGPFAAYAQELLGIGDAVTETDTLYVLDHFETGTRTTADPNRVYKVNAESGIDLQLLTLNNKGLLYGYNVQEEKSAKKKDHNKPHMQKSSKREPVAPLSEEALHTSDPYERAKVVQRQILQLREARTYLLLGESEHQPADGVAMETLLQSIDEQEQALLLLFTGTVQSQKMNKTLYYAPSQSTQVILGRFDRHHGIVNESGDGQPITLTIEVEEQRLSAPATVAKKAKNAPVASPIYYNLPGSAHYQLHMGEEMIREQKIAVAQLGVSIPLTRDLLRSDNHITIDTKTGNIQSICK